MIHPGVPGPWVRATKGEPWPKPKVTKYSGQNYSVVQPGDFQFEVIQNNKIRDNCKTQFCFTVIPEQNYFQLA